MPRPFVNYIGSKMKFMNKLEFPETINNYYEPFVGGGSVLLHLFPRINGNVYINDLDADLINVYQVVKTRVQELIVYLSMMNKDKCRDDFDYYVYMYNSREIDDVFKAAIYIYINKTSFNGKMGYNEKTTKIDPYYVEIKENRKIFDRQNIEAISSSLNGVSISCEDYITFLRRQSFKENDFVFLDPPYLVSQVKTYYKNTFDRECYTILKSECDRLNSLGVKWMITLNNNELFRDLFKDYKIKEIKKYSHFSCGLGQENEIIIINF